MAFSTVLTRLLGIEHPVLVAPMAGGPSTPELVAAAAEAGAFGFLAGAYGTPEQIRQEAAAVRARTARPFGINLFAPTPAPEPPAGVAPALGRLAPFHAELGLPAPALAAPGGPSLEARFEAAIDCGAAVFSFTFGVLPEAMIAAAKARGMHVFGTATTVEEAEILERAGVDAVVAQGSEAGGHRGTFAAPFEQALIGTIALVPQIADRVRVPVIASGGIMDGRGLVAALALGAAAVQMGTAFLTCEEAGIPAAYRDAILGARPDETRVTRAFSGRPARGIANRFMLEVEDPCAPDAILPFPLQNALTRPLRTAAAKQGRAEFLSLWAGQGVSLARAQTAGELVARLVRELDEVIGTLRPVP